MFKKLLGHYKTVLKHKFYVFVAMKQCGRPIRGLLHDLSKFSFTEFCESVKYYSDGKSSPINAAKANIGYSKAWFHHRGRNKHHSQYWVDMSFGEITPCKIPYEYLIELICDTIGAGKAYMGDSWTESAPLDYFNSMDSKSFYHHDTRMFLLFIYTSIKNNGWDYVANTLRNDYYKRIYR